MSSTRPLLVVTAAVAALAIGGCQQNLPAQKAKTEKLICVQLAEAGQALERVAALKPTSTVGEAKAADQALASAVAKLEASEEKLENLRLKTFKQQLRTFRGEVETVSRNKGLTLEMAANLLKAKAGPVIAARQALTAEVDCVETPAAAPAAPKAPAAPAKP
ncbi:MAG: hypothetical protein ACK587_01820 [Cyanobacteriota bacterium]